MTGFLPSIPDFIHSYSFYYFLGLLTAVVLALREGYNRQFGLHSWAVVVASAVLGGIIGSKAVFISAEILKSLPAGFALPEVVQKSFLGGLFGGIIGVGISRRALGFDRSSIDAFAVPVFAGLAIGRIGCWFGGCCFGVRSSVPWTVIYDKHTPVYAAQLQAGLIEPGALASLPVHPVPFYDLLICIGIIALIWIYGKSLKAPGNVFWASAAIYGTARFFEEFVRYHEPAAEIVSPLQIVLILASTALFAMVLVRERKYRDERIIYSSHAPSHGRVILSLSVLILVYAGIYSWLTPIETLVSTTVIGMLSLLVLVINPFSSSGESFTIKSGTAFAAVNSAALALVWFQVVPDTLHTTIDRISARNVRGKYIESESCDKEYHRYGVIEGGLSRTIPVDDYRRITLGIDGFAGNDEEYGSKSVGDYPSDSLISLKIRGISPYVEYHSRWVGVGIGADIGDLVSRAERRTSPIGRYSLRLGPFDKFFGEMVAWNSDNSVLPLHNGRLGLGFVVSKRHVVKFGFSSSGSYMNTDIALSRSFYLNTSLARNTSRRNRFSVGLSYLFRHR